MTEREERDLEKLKTTEDYINEIKFVSDVVCGTKKADKEIDETLTLLAVALKAKYKYIIKISSPYRKKQGFFSRLRDKSLERQERKMQEKREKAEDALAKFKEEYSAQQQGKEQQQLPQPTTEVQVLEKPASKPMLPNPDSDEPLRF